jgi:hypothetical protein
LQLAFRPSLIVENDQAHGPEKGFPGEKIAFLQYLYNNIKVLLLFLRPTALAQLYHNFKNF